MPSVEMRRSTRVFVPKAKDAELVKVLRSGRRLWVDSSDAKQHRGSNEDEWFTVIEKPVPRLMRQRPEEELGSIGRNGGSKPDLMGVEEEEAPVAVEMERSKRSSLVFERRNVGRLIRNVYSRKRKRCDFGSINADGVSPRKRKFGLHFVRRQKKKIVESSMEKTGGEIEIRKRSGFVSSNADDMTILSVVLESHCGGYHSISLFLSTLLRYLWTGKVELVEIWGFLQSTPILDVFSSVGIRCFSDCPCMRSRGVCRIRQGKLLVPFFTVDFSIVPSCFMEIHIALMLRSARGLCLSWMESSKEDEGPVVDLPFLCPTGEKYEPLINNMFAPDLKDCPKGRKIVVAALEACKLGGSHAVPCRTRNAVPFRSRNSVPFRSGVLTRSSSKRRRRSLRSRRARNPSHFVVENRSGLSISDNATLKQTIMQLSAGMNTERRRSFRKNPSDMGVARNDAPADVSVPKSGSLDLTIDTDSPQCCFVNVLVVEIDRCYRVEGAEVSLDLSSSNEWVLAVKKDGLIRHSLKAQREIRPNATNRFTHAIVWSAENGWKLEFPNRKDWLVFKELNKVCGEKNLVPTSPDVKIIPVPGVLEVTNSWDLGSSPFKRPESYIKMTSDELSRVLLSRTANYDMDSEDEAWLSKFNSELDEENLLSEETFELMVDAFEKASYCSLEGFTYEKALRLDLASPKVVEPVYRYWMKKRKRGVPLLRVFELNEPKRTQLISKPVLRKKRSLKRTPNVHPIQRGRGKDSSVLQALACEQNAMEEQHAVLRVQEAKASADKFVEVAISKRQRAQFLMENADLAMYRATMAIRIADAAGRVGDSQQAAAYFLD